MSVTTNANVRKVERLPNTASGNPVWRIGTDVGTFRTKDDSACGHVITPDDRGEAVITLDGRRQIIAYTLN